MWPIVRFVKTYRCVAVISDQCPLVTHVKTRDYLCSIRIVLQDQFVGECGESVSNRDETFWLRCVDVRCILRVGKCVNAVAYPLGVAADLGGVWRVKHSDGIVSDYGGAQY